jgi:hypothetical protein
MLVLDALSLNLTLQPLGQLPHLSGQHFLPYQHHLAYGQNR